MNLSTLNKSTNSKIEFSDVSAEIANFNKNILNFNKNATITNEKTINFEVVFDEKTTNFRVDFSFFKFDNKVNKSKNNENDFNFKNNFDVTNYFNILKYLTKYNNKKQRIKAFYITKFDFTQSALRHFFFIQNLIIIV